MPLLTRTPTIAVLGLSVLLTLSACSEVPSAPEISPRTATAPVVPITPIAFKYAVTLAPCKRVVVAPRNMCANASVTGTVTVDPNTAMTPGTVMLKTAMWWSPVAAAAGAMAPPAGAVAVAGPADGGPANVAIPAAVGRSEKTVDWAKWNVLRGGNALDIPAGMFFVCLSGEITVNNVQRAKNFTCAKL